MGEITAVSRISGTAADDSVEPSSDDSRFDVVVASCEQRLTDMLPPLEGDVLLLHAQRTTALTGWIQLPTANGWKDGQRWIACSAELHPGPGLQLGQPLANLLGPAGVDPSILACLRSSEGGNYIFVGCSEPYTVELLATYDIDAPPDAPFPGADALAADALTSCQTVNAATGTEVILSTDSTFYRTPNERGWDDGKRQVDCGIVRDLRR